MNDWTGQITPIIYLTTIAAGYCIRKSTVEKIVVDTGIAFYKVLSNLTVPNTEEEWRKKSLLIFQEY